MLLLVSLPFWLAVAAVVVTAQAPPPSSEPTQPPTPTPTDAESAARQRVMASYDTAKTLIGALNNQSSPGHRRKAEDAIADFREDIQENADRSAEDREDFLSKFMDLQDDLNDINDIVEAIDNWNDGLTNYSISSDMTLLPDRGVISNIRDMPRPFGTPFLPDRLTTLVTTRISDTTQIRLTYDGFNKGTGTPVTGLSRDLLRKHWKTPSAPVLAF